MKKILRLALDMLMRPGRAVDAILRPGAALRESAWVFAASMAANAFLFSVKPAGFPSPEMEGGLPPGAGLLFLVGVELWQAVLTGVLVAATGWFGWLLQGGPIGPKLLLAVLCGGVPAVSLVLFTNPGLTSGNFPAPLFALSWILMGAAMAPGLRRVQGAAWKSLLSLMMAANAVAVALLPLLLAAVHLRLADAYYVLELVLAFWTLGLCTYGASRILGLAAARAFSSIFLAVLMQVVFVYSMNALGLLSKDSLRALMTF
ncbi:MAG: hypothetical protein WC728_12225 [Elusimicrobiota bacterium]